jgi:hypothetical protein
MEEFKYANKSIFFGLGLIISYGNFLAIPVEEELEDDDGVQGKGNCELKSISRVLRFFEDHSSTGSGSSPVQEEGGESQLPSGSCREVLPDLRDTRSDIENDCGGGNH